MASFNVCSGDKKNGSILLTDTVGFIRKLPHNLVEAFKSTLEEAKYADYIIHVVDCSNPQAVQQMEVVYDTLQELGVQGKKTITLFNKVDVGAAIRMRDSMADHTLKVSAKTGEGLEDLKQLLGKILSEEQIYVEKIFSYQEVGKIDRALAAESICQDILSSARNQLYLNMRFMDCALSALFFQGDMGVHPVGTDGTVLYYQPEELMEQFRRSQEKVNRIYLHSLLHCIFLHCFPEKDEEGNPAVDVQYWNLACDITVENIIDGLYLKCVHQPASMVKRQALKLILEEGKVMTAQRIYRRLQTLHLPENKMQELRREFTQDDHGKWYENHPNSPQMSQRKKNWDDIRNRMQTEMETFSKEAGEGGETLVDQLRAQNQNRYDYKEFLRKFSVLKEEMKVDMDTFDYIFYNYGMNLYGNMPLIDPSAQDCKRADCYRRL